MIKWTGKDISKRMTWKAEAETYKELAEKLADLGLIHSLYNEEQQTWLADLGLIHSLYNEEQQTWLERLYSPSDPYEAYETMTEEDWRTFIGDSKGMAYYQEIIEE